jgi:ABC-type antimicrobial peptide transport system permease subunit
VPNDYSAPPPAGTTLEFRNYLNTSTGEWDPDNYEVTGNWTFPSTAKNLGQEIVSSLHSSILATPGALNRPTADDDSANIVALVDKNLTDDQLEGIRNSAAEYRWQAFAYSYNTGPDLHRNQDTYLSIRNALYAGSILTLLLAGVSMLVLALEHIRERRRSLAVLTASGVPRGVLARSLLWQVALPITLGVAMAILTGIGLAALMVPLTEKPLFIDWSGIALMSAGAIALTLLVSAMTLPFLRSATRLTTLRTE